MEPETWKKQDAQLSDKQLSDWFDEEVRKDIKSIRASEHVRSLALRRGIGPERFVSIDTKRTVTVPIEEKDFFGFRVNRTIYSISVTFRTGNSRAPFPNSRVHLDLSEGLCQAT